LTIKILDKDNSIVEITHVSSYGIWILSRDNELFTGRFFIIAIPDKTKTIKIPKTLSMKGFFCLDFN
jgi:hypothetical protein